MCDTKFSIYLYSVRFGIRACAGGHVSPGFSVVGMVLFLLACYLRCFIFFSLFMFLSFSLFHLEGCRIRLNDQPVSGMPSYFES